jgi:hypothetical protein
MLINGMAKSMVPGFEQALRERLGGQSPMPNPNG